jgi:hypothetical protein
MDQVAADAETLEVRVDRRVEDERVGSAVPDGVHEADQPTSRPELNAPTQVRLWRSSLTAHGMAGTSASVLPGWNALWCSRDSAAPSTGNLTFSSAFIASIRHPQETVSGPHRLPDTVKGGAYRWNSSRIRSAIDIDSSCGNSGKSLLR